jgi:hypothetical protein
LGPSAKMSALVPRQDSHLRTMLWRPDNGSIPSVCPNPTSFEPDWVETLSELVGKAAS